MEQRILIVNADDFGQSSGINAGIMEAYERGILTSASMMTRWPAARDAAAYARRNPGIGVGLHIDLGEWVYGDGNWRKLYEVVPEDDGQAVSAEIHRQLDSFRALMSAEPTHIDSHQHAHRQGTASEVAARIAGELRVPLRSCTPSVRYHGSFYGQNDNGVAYHDMIGAAALIATVNALPIGITELGCHPAKNIDITTMYAEERMIELETLCDGRVRDAISSAGVLLRSFVTCGFQP